MFWRNLFVNFFCELVIRVETQMILKRPYLEIRSYAWSLFLILISHTCQHLSLRSHTRSQSDDQALLHVLNLTETLSKSCGPICTAQISFSVHKKWFSPFQQAFRRLLWTQNDSIWEYERITIWTLLHTWWKPESQFFLRGGVLYD